MNHEDEIPRDEELTAYIDGELSPAEAARIEAFLETDVRVAQRLEFLSRSNLPFRSAFEPLLAAAPRETLEAMVGTLAQEATPSPARSLGRRGFLAAMAASLVAGVMADRVLVGLRRKGLTDDESSEWRAVVAEYIALYTTDTLAEPMPSAAAQAAQLARVNERLGLSLSAEAVSIPGIDFKRAQLLQYDDKPLAQIAYLDPETGPMALCIVQSGIGQKGPDLEGRKGMNVIYWSSNTHAFMLIGRMPADRIAALADGVMRNLPA